MTGANVSAKALSFAPLKPVELSLAYQYFVSHMQPIVEQACGWDEGFQQTSFSSRLQLEWFEWVEQDDERVGLVCQRAKLESRHLHLLIIFAHKQRQGIGAAVLNCLIDRARSHNQPLTLSCFNNNLPAVAMYRNLDFLSLLKISTFTNSLKLNPSLDGSII